MRFLLDGQDGTVLEGPVEDVRLVAGARRCAAESAPFLCAAPQAAEDVPTSLLSSAFQNWAKEPSLMRCQTLLRGCGPGS